MALTVTNVVASVSITTPTGSKFHNITKTAIQTTTNYWTAHAKLTANAGVNVSNPALRWKMYMATSPENLTANETAAQALFPIALKFEGPVPQRPGEFVILGSTEGEALHVNGGYMYVWFELPVTAGMTLNANTVEATV